MLGSLAQAEKSIAAVSEACRRVFRNMKDGRIIAVFLYGSVLTGNWRPDSDLDIAVLDRVEEPLSWSEQASLMDALERSTAQPVDLRVLRECLVSHQVHVLTCGRPLWVTEPISLETYKESVLKDFKGSCQSSHDSWVATLKMLSEKVELPS